MIIDHYHKFHNVPVSCPTMHHSEQKCAQSCSEWCIVRYGTGAFGYLWIWSIIGLILNLPHSSPLWASYGAFIESMRENWPCYKDCIVFYYWHHFHIYIEREINIWRDCHPFSLEEIHNHIFPGGMNENHISISGGHVKDHQSYLQVRGAAPTVGRRWWRSPRHFFPERSRLTRILTNNFLRKSFSNTFCFGCYRTCVFLSLLDLKSCNYTFWVKLFEVA